MSFDSGTISFRLFHLREPLQRNALDKFAANVVAPLETLAREPLQGWVSPRHLLDREITEEHCFFSSWIHVVLLRAEKRVPPPLLRAYCRIEEEIERRARKVEVLHRKVRAEIKERVMEQLQPGMPPTLTGAGLVADLRNERLLVEALSDSQIDRFTPLFRETTGQVPLVMTPEMVAMLRQRVNATDLLPSSFTSDTAVESDPLPSLGLEFMTWLWYAWEREGGVFTLPHSGEFGYMLEGPLLFYREGEGAHEAVLRKGTPLLSREAGTALHCGKKLKRAKLHLARADQLWSATIDADFSFRSVKLPPGEQKDTIGRFQERMIALETFLEAFFVLYDKFLKIRCDRSAWSLCQTAIQNWVTEKTLFEHEADSDA